MDDNDFEIKRGTPPSFNTFIKDEDGNLKYEYVDTKYIIAGDTDSSYVLLEHLFDRDAKQEDVVNCANDIGVKVNAAFPEFMRDVFNVRDDRMFDNGRNVIATDREVVSDKSLFKAKKHYIMHIVDKEGQSVDKNKIMGLEIRKSDTPKIVQDFLKEMVLAIMDQCDYYTVRYMIDKFQQQYTSATFQQIGRPMSLNILKKYEDMYAMTPSMKGFPYHVRAAMFYNGLAGVNDVRIRSGDKIAVCYIRHPTSKYVAVPIDADELPSFVKELEIDWDAQWDTVMKKINNYLTPLGWDVESRQEEVFSSFVKF